MRTLCDNTVTGLAAFWLSSSWTADMYNGAISCNADLYIMPAMTRKTAAL